MVKAIIPTDSSFFFVLLLTAVNNKNSTRGLSLFLQRRLLINLDYLHQEAKISTNNYIKQQQCQIITAQINTNEGINAIGGFIC